MNAYIVKTLVYVSCLMCFVLLRSQNPEFMLAIGDFNLASPRLDLEMKLRNVVVKVSLFLDAVIGFMGNWCDIPIIT